MIARKGSRRQIFGGKEFRREMMSFRRKTETVEKLFVIGVRREVWKLQAKGFAHTRHLRAADCSL